MSNVKGRVYPSNLNDVSSDKRLGDSSFRDEISSFRDGTLSHAELPPSKFKRGSAFKRDIDDNESVNLLSENQFSSPSPDLAGNRRFDSSDS